ncbi:hypothetical protein LY474_05865 [Myxococcus stipitatus]|uniref:hypothetical protein n=1 Tax=Myxococcus stipitatus TaxID=83455 RepID=UPI001F30F9B3|nr:hypothetical protein [Myxococcus stipitatus]MCE9667336.1 hypothetical protein [Myxococcus stipitatus]
MPAPLGAPPAAAPARTAPRPPAPPARESSGSFDDATSAGAPSLGGEEADPFGSIDIDDATVTEARPAPLAAPPSRAPAPAGAFGLDDLTLPGRPPVGASPPAAAPEADPFGSIDIDDATVPGHPPAPAPARGVAESTGFALPGRPLQGVPGASPRQGAGAASARPPTGPAPSATRGGPPAPAGTPPPSARAPGAVEPFSLDAVAPPGKPATSGPTPPPLDGADPFASLDTVAPPPGKPATSGPTPPPLGGADPFASLDIDDATAAGQPPAASAPVPGAQDLFDLSGDPFGEHAGLQPTETGRAALLGTSAPDAPADGSLLGDVPPMDTGLGVSLGRVGGAGQREVLDMESGLAAPSISVAKPTARPEDVGIPQARPPSRARKATALVLNLVVAAVLVVGLGAVGLTYAREGRLDLSVLAPEQLEALFVPPPKPLVAVDVSNGLYETRSGRPVFYIRGEVENRTRGATHVRVKGALFDGAQRVRAAEGLAGAVATPEEVHEVGNADAATALRQRMDSAAIAVAPGARAPFLLVFQEYPADLGDFRLEVSAEPAPPPAKAAEPAPSQVAPAPTE